MRRGKLHGQLSKAYVSSIHAAPLSQIYASGQRRGREGAGSNPHPRGSAEHTYWANGYAAGRADRFKG